jgi:hypothetical protein
MILQCRAEYESKTDSIQVGILVQEDDATSASSLVKQGIVEILQGNVAAITETFTADHKVWLHESGAFEDFGHFYFFVLHPRTQRNMSVRVAVELSDGRSATTKVPIEVTQDPEKDAWQNPALASRGPTTYEVETDFP